MLEELERVSQNIYDLSSQLPNDEQKLDLVIEIEGLTGRFLTPTEPRSTLHNNSTTATMTEPDGEVYEQFNKLLKSMKGVEEELRNIVEGTGDFFDLSVATQKALSDWESLNYFAITGKEQSVIDLSTNNGIVGKFLRNTKGNFYDDAVMFTIKREELEESAKNFTHYKINNIYKETGESGSQKYEELITLGGIDVQRYFELQLGVMDEGGEFNVVHSVEYVRYLSTMDTDLAMVRTSEGDLYLKPKASTKEIDDVLKSPTDGSYAFLDDSGQVIEPSSDIMADEVTKVVVTHQDGYEVTYDAVNSKY